MTDIYANAVDYPSLVFTSGGTAQWTVDSDVSYYGGSSAKSGVISHNQNSYLQTTVTGPIAISFWWKVSSEGSWDWLRFYVDAEKKYEISGTVDWQQKTYTIPEGSHVLKWEYSKDGSASAGSDCGWIDKIEFAVPPPEPVYEWVTLFDPSVWNGRDTPGTATMLWQAYNPSFGGPLWQARSYYTFDSNPAPLTPVNQAYFDGIRPGKIKATFWYVTQYIDVIIYFSDGDSFTFNNGTNGNGIAVDIPRDRGAITKICILQFGAYPTLYIPLVGLEFAIPVPEPEDDGIPDTVRNEMLFRLTIADNSAVIPLSNCNIQFRIEMKDANGETLPAWESTSSPFANGYASDKCLYRLFFNGTVPGIAKIAEITAGLSGFSELIFEYSNQTVNGVPDWNELCFVRPAMKTATPSYGAQSQSISLYAERENLVSAYTWDYQEVDISGVSFRSPNQQGGKWTYHMAGLITGIKPGYKATYNGDSFVVGQIQYIINTTGITTYLKEY